MSLKIQNSRQLLKRSTTSGATPSVFTGSTDYTDGTWGVNDIYAGEFYWNMADRKLFLGYETTGGTGVDLIYPQGSSSASCLTDLYVSNLYGCSPINLWDNIIIQTGTTLTSCDGFGYIQFDNAGVGETLLNWNDGNFNSQLIQGNQFTLYVTDNNTSANITFQVAASVFQADFPNVSTFYSMTDTATLNADSHVLRGEAGITLSSHHNDAGNNTLIFTPSAVTLNSLQIQNQSNDGSVQTSYDQTPTTLNIKAQDNGVSVYANKIGIDASAVNIHAEDMSNSYLADISVSLTNPQAVMYASDGVDDVTFTIKPTIATLTNVPKYDDDSDAGSNGLNTGDIYQTTGNGAAPLDVVGILMIKQ